MSLSPFSYTSDSGDSSITLSPEANILGEYDKTLRNNRWLYGFRVDNMDGPQVVALQVASYVIGSSPYIEEKNDTFVEVVNTHTKRGSNYVHHGWSIGAVATLSPWIASRIDAEDLIATSDFQTAIEEALKRPTRFEQFHEVYRALSRWGDVVPLEVEMGYSLSLTDTEANFSRLLPGTLDYSLTHLPTINTANVTRKGATSYAGWNEASAMIDVPPIEWRPVKVVEVLPTLKLLPNELQAQLTNLYAERVEIRGTAHIIGLSTHYFDGVISRGGKDGGNHHMFTLTEGEHIIEMLTCADGEWLRGIQFITNMGRCSVIYGSLEGTPVISRSKGGILVGLTTSTKKHSEWDYLVTGVNVSTTFYEPQTYMDDATKQGIWRCDFLRSVPKENDVYSDYFGAKTHNGTGFNDRALIGNSSSMHISSVEIWSGDDGIDGIQFIYRDTRNSQSEKIKSVLHGGSGSSHHQFELRDGEYVVSVSGKYNDRFLTQLCFGTNRGRTSDIYGGGSGRSFSTQAPIDKAGRYHRLQYILGKRLHEMYALDASVEIERSLIQFSRRTHSMADTSPLAKQISMVSDWLATVEVIRTNLKLPDLTTKSGLRQVARSPHKVYPRLEKAYTDHLKDPLALGALALIWGRIWTESRARQALYDTGFLINIIRLITTTPDCRIPALQSIVTIVHHASQPVLTDIAHRTTRTLLLLLRSDAESVRVHELCIIILTHTAAASLDTLRSDGIDYNTLIQALSRAVHRPNSTHTMQTHFLGFLRVTSSRLHFNISADPSSVHFIIAHFPSTNFATRGDALLALNDLYASGAEQERSSWDPNAYYRAALAAQTELSDDILERMEIHMGGQLMACDIYVNTRATDDFQDAMATVLEDKDMYTLAKRLYPLILSTESSIPQGAFRDKHGELIPLEELGLPFSSFIDALPLAADAIRMRGIPGERLAADVIEVKHALLTRQNAVVRQNCSERIESDSHVAFFYYAMVLAASSSGGDPSAKRMPTAERLKLAKRGLLCEGAPTEDCIWPPMGRVKPSNDNTEDSDEDEELSPRRTMKYYTEAVVYLTSALEDARSYTRSAPLDYRLHKSVLLMETILTIVLEGRPVRELESLISQQEIVDQLYTTLYSEIPRTHSRLVINSIIPNWESAQQEWDTLLRKFDRRAPVGEPEHTHNHPHDVEEGLHDELEPEMDFGFSGRPPTYISTLDIPALVHPSGALIPVVDVDKSRQEEELRQAYVGIPGMSSIEPSPITPITPVAISPQIPVVSPCPLDRKPFIDEQIVPIAQYMCSACHNPSDGSDLKTCSGCRRTKYCDEVCQKKHWINGHGDECLPETI
ncbi:MYND finger [Rhizoctonia solani]|uniref:MYND finger n=1 Tax=Rhizoctonia solani TaxID=456999 RepID=A0A8H7I4F3_9AGAM|nr:MYND finger [Rhizoctonia solani]